MGEPALSQRVLVLRFADTENYFVSEASVYRLLKALYLITRPAFIVMKAADEFTAKTTASNQLWQTYFTYLQVIGWGWYLTCLRLSEQHSWLAKWRSAGFRPPRHALAG